MSGMIVTVTERFSAHSLTVMGVISAKVVAKPRNTRKPWAVRYWTDNGHQRETSFRTQREAADAKDKMLAESRAPEATVTFGDTFELWITQHPIKASTRRHYRELYRARIRKPLADRKLLSVARDPDGVEAIANCEPGKTILGIVCGTVAWAQRQGKISDNRLVRSTLKHRTVRRVREHVAYTPGQLAAITASLGRHGITVQVMHYTGCRISEALALTPDDFNGDPGSYGVCISKQRDHDTGADTDLKVAGKSRTVPVPDILYRAVREHALRYGTGRGRLAGISRDQFSALLLAASAKAGARMTAHNLRHDYALRMERAGVRVTDFARLIGDTERTVIETYLSHPSREADALVRADGRPGR